MKLAYGSALTGLCCVAISSSAVADPMYEVTAEICNNAGVCTPVDPETAVIIFALAQIATELSKDDPFGKNNDLVKSIKEMIDVTAKGASAAANAVDNGISDLRCGPGPNNDIVKFLKTLGIHLSTSNHC